MAEEEKAEKEVGGEGEKEGEEKAKPKGGLVKILIIAIIVIVVLLIVVAVASFVAKKQAQPPELEFEPEVVHNKEELPPKPLHVYIIGNYLARLSDPEEDHYVKLTDVTLLYDAEKYDLLSAELGERQSQIQDIINTILIGKTMEVGSQEGKKALKEEIKNALNEILREGKIADINFQIIIQ